MNNSYVLILVIVVLVTLVAAQFVILSESFALLSEKLNIPFAGVLQVGGGIFLVLITLFYLSRRL